MRNENTVGEKMKKEMKEKVLNVEWSKGWRSHPTCEGGGRMIAKAEPDEGKGKR